MELLLDQPAISSSGSLGQPKAARLAVGAVFFMNGGLFASWVSRLPAVQAERGLSHGTLGLALLAIAAGAVVAMPLAGWGSSRFGSHSVTRLTGALYCAGLPLLMLAPNMWFFALALFCFGMAHGGIDVSMNTQAVAVEQRYGKPINSSFHALFSLGGLVGAAAGGFAAAAGVAPLLHFATAAVILGGATALLAFPHLLDAGEGHSHSVSNEVEKSARFTWPPRTLLVLGIVAFCVMMGEGAMADWSAVFLRQVVGTSDGVSAAGYAAFSIAMAIGRFSGDWLSIRLGPVTLVRMSGALAASGLAVALIFSRPVAALAGFAAVGIGFAAVVPQVFTAAGRTPGLSASTALSIATTIGYFGFLVGPPLIGFAAELIGLRGALGIVAVLSLLITCLAPIVRTEAAVAR